MAEHQVSYARTEEQDLIASTARQFLEEHAPLGRVRELMMSDDGFDRDLWKQMADLGWMGLAIAESHGGAGLGPPDVGVLLEEMGRLVTPGPYFASAILATTAIQEVAPESRQAELLPELATGDVIASVALFESPRGWDVTTPVTRATRSGDDWVLDGEKRSVLDGHISDRLLVSAATDDGVGLFAVESGADGVSVTQEPALDPTRRQATVSLDAVRVGPDQRLDDDGAEQGLQRTILLASIALAAEQVGGAQHCLDMAVEYAKSRYQFGRPIGSYQAVKHICANMLMRVEHARSAAYYAARVTEDDEELRVAAPLALSVASDTYVWVAGENIQVHGGIGFTWEHDAHIYLKRAKTSSLMAGSPRYQRDRLGQALGI